VPNAELLFVTALVVLSPLSLFCYGKLTRELLSPDHPRSTEPYRTADAILASVVGVFFLLLIYLGLEAGDVSPTPATILQGGIFYICVCFIILSFLICRDISPLKAFGLDRANAKTLAASLGWLLLAYPIVIGLSAVFLAFNGETPDEQAPVKFLREQTDPANIALMVVFAVVVAPVTEELLFRGYLYGVMKRYGGALSAALVSAMLFSAIHLHPASFLALFGLAICMTLVYEHTGTLWAPILMHATFNGVSVGFILLFPEIPSP